jgi:hypothetical protein
LVEQTGISDSAKTNCRSPIIEGGQWNGNDIHAMAELRVLQPARRFARVVVYLDLESVDAFRMDEWDAI